MPHPMWKCVCSISNCALPLCSVSKSACLSVPYQSIPCPSVPYQSIPSPSVPYQGIPCPLYFWRKLYAVLADGEGGNSGLFQVPVLLFEELFALWFMDISFQHLLPLLPYCVVMEPYFELFFSFFLFFFFFLFWPFSKYQYDCVRWSAIHLCVYFVPLWSFGLFSVLLESFYVSHLVL